MIEKYVTSYRVREFNKSHFLVELYSMEFTDEMNSYTENRHNYYIRYNSFLKEKRRFQNDIIEKSRLHEYEFEGNENDMNDIDTFNFYLATHYFMHKTSDSYDHFNYQLSKLNEQANKYMREHNRSILEDSYATDISNARETSCTQLSRASSLLRAGISHIECVNVAQANFSIGYDNSDGNPLAVFDIGIRCKVSNTRSYAISKLQQIDENGITVISHYDFDHINGYRYLRPCAADRIWILPEKRLSPSSAERGLLALLKPENCIFLKDIDYSTTPFNRSMHTLKIGNLTIFQGNAKKIDTNQSTDENARSLICLVKKNRSILLPADCLYKEFPTNFDIEYLIIPHHGCSYEGPISNINNQSLKKLVICAGPHLGYKHPNIAHIQKLINPNCQAIYLMNEPYVCVYHNPFLISCQSAKITTPSHKIHL